MTEPRPLTMTGVARGSNVDQLKASAISDAKAFFGTDCVSVEMLEALEVAPSVYHARFRAREHHERVSPSNGYGAIRCRVCHREEYASGPKLPTANWEEVSRG